jgi:hypothetical protein
MVRRKGGRFKEEEALRKNEKVYHQSPDSYFIEEVGTHDKARRYSQYSLHHPGFLYHRYHHYHHHPH